MATKKTTAKEFVPLTLESFPWNVWALEETNRILAELPAKERDGVLKELMGDGEEIVIMEEFCDAVLCQYLEGYCDCECDEEDEEGLEEEDEDNGNEK